ncbi:hypothetical protein FBEOM_1258 [Fusarium beomiforme]|uniref:Uncharacterized protein n=1 Tax=Fusarium beomiforme TaxID=44412 RepID=A0A9P5AU90_9HYPO|nr:hypothetical protein FBEOM_1258 [Fusarium beomiforme]
MSDQSPLAILTDPIDIPRITCTRRDLKLDYFGPVDDSLASKSSGFLARLTNAAEKEAKPTISAFLRTTYDDCIGHADEKSSCWLTIRITKPSTEFEIPRWHQDGNMYRYDQGRENVVRSKYALTLLGPPTLMLEPDEHVFTTQRKAQEQFCPWWYGDGPGPSEEEKYDAEDELREHLMKEFKDIPRVIVGRGRVVRFSWGREDSPVHSEPDLVADRVFMTVLYGSEPELRSMCEWREAEYGKFSEE